MLRRKQLSTFTSTLISRSNSQDAASNKYIRKCIKDMNFRPALVDAVLGKFTTDGGKLDSQPSHTSISSHPAEEDSQGDQMGSGAREPTPLIVD
jgi:hypothetical protein